MGIYFSNIRSLLEVKRKVDGRDEDLDEENNNEQPDQNEEPENNENQDDNDVDEHEPDNSASDYSMDVEDDESEEGDEAEQASNEPQDGNDEDEHEADNSASDYSMDVEDDEDNSGDENNNEESDDTESEGDDTDGYSMDTDSDSDENTDDNADDNESDDSSTEDSTGGGDDELKSLENDIFKDISPEQMNIKILELKKQYLEVYTVVEDVLTRTNKIQKTTQNIKVLEFIINKLMELKDIVQFYLSNTFDTKSYMENMVNYQQYLATLNTINRLLKEINVKKGK